MRAAGLAGREFRRSLEVPAARTGCVGYKFNVRVNCGILFEAPYAPMRAAS